jgi:hypothetical protein
MASYLWNHFSVQGTHGAHMTTLFISLSFPHSCTVGAHTQKKPHMREHFVVDADIVQHNLWFIGTSMEKVLL